MAVFLLAYGVARQTLLKKNSSFMWNSVAEIFFVPYFQVYGELFIEKEHLFSSKCNYELKHYCLEQVASLGAG